MHTVLAVDVYSDKIKHLFDAAEGQEVVRRPWSGRILGIAQKTTSSSFTSQHVKCMGKR
ncbi:hypothetical protein ZIOFF_031859 [Zingiber officinale]|uniref:Uncharacterized protein n=1 Tax=Zingiber officinale TaxID=94328 RepID=A0A8J5GMX4_ZINOF|nr:hypothetical protein ZIOFF_031859 [Zingiber officinale]